MNTNTTTPSTPSPTPTRHLPGLSDLAESIYGYPARPNVRRPILSGDRL